MDENYSYDYLLDDPQLLLDCHRNNTNFTFRTNRQYNFTLKATMSNNNCEGYDLTSYATFDYINKMLLEEDIDEKFGTYEDEATLHATEKIFYDILEQKYPSLPAKSQLGSPSNGENSGDCSNSSYGEARNGSSQSRSIECTHSKQLSRTFDPVPKNIPVSQFNKGFEEALKFVPDLDKLFISSKSAIGASASLKSQSANHLVDNKSRGSEFGAKKKFNSDPELDVIEGRAWKQKAISSYELVRDETMDKALLWRGEKYIDDVSTIREMFQKEMKDESQKTRLEILNTRKNGSKKQLNKSLVDLEALLMSCAQAVYINDYAIASEKIKQIREHSSHNGDSSQRLAFYMVDGLEARLVGTGSEIYRKIKSKPVPFSDALKSYRFYLAASPFKRAQSYFSNQTIFNSLKNESHIHIIDFGIQFGFQWPSFFERFINWKTTTPKIRITGVDKAQSGFRPYEQVIETGKRLADYAKSFKLPFEYKGITYSKWEDIKIEEVDVHENELLVANCICNEILFDGIVSTDSTRDNVLSVVKKLNPHILILGVINSSFNGPYFVSRFKKALHLYSSLFDMLHTTMPRDNQERYRLEKRLGETILNTVACEGSERVERPESYKHWQSRTARMGFVQLPLDKSIVKMIKDLVKSLYHKEFLTDEDNGWLLMGWKGRILFAMSTWKPN